MASLGLRSLRWLLPAALVYTQAYVLALDLFQLSVVQTALPANDNWAYVGLVPLPPVTEGKRAALHLRMRSCQCCRQSAHRCRISAPLCGSREGPCTVGDRGTGYYLGREAALIVMIALGGLGQAARERICAATGEVRSRVGAPCPRSTREVS